MKNNDYSQAIEFLLGKMSRVERFRMERRFFTDKEFFEEILIAENELIDAYATGQVSPEERSLFQNRLLLNPRQHQRVKFAKMLVEYASKRFVPVPDADLASTEDVRISYISRFLSNKTLLAFYFAFTTIIIMAGGIWMISDSLFREERTDQLTTSKTPQDLSNRESVPILENTANSDDKERSENSSRSKPSAPKQISPPSTPKKVLPTPKPKASVLALTLSPGLTRGTGNGQEFIIPPKTNLVNIQLKQEADESFLSYQAILETVEGRQVWRSNKLKAANGKSISLLIPAGILIEADYILFLKGLGKNGMYETAGNYTFSIKRQ